MANPRKFSEKIALHAQKQAEGTAAFEAILREVSATTRVRTVSPSPHAFRPPYDGLSIHLPTLPAVHTSGPVSPSDTGSACSQIIQSAVKLLWRYYNNAFLHQSMVTSE